MFRGHGATSVSTSGAAAQEHILWFTAVDMPLNPAELVQSPNRLQAKLEWLFYLHDQQTGGIPGINILYKGLKVRVTQKLVKTKSATILKHSPGTVIGWDLHRMDQEFVDGSERYCTW